MQFREIPFGSGSYEAAQVLREAVLRRPLGLTLSAADLAGEALQLHYGLFSEDNELLACVSAVPLSSTEAKVRQTAVVPERQRSGLGKRMLLELESDLRSKGFTQVCMHARVDAVGFYQQLGYVPMGQEFVEVTIPHRRMEKHLAKAD